MVDWQWNPDIAPYQFSFCPQLANMVSLYPNVGGDILNQTPLVSGFQDIAWVTFGDWRMNFFIFNLQI